MSKDFLEELKKLALYFKLESGPKYGGAIDIESLYRVLKGLNTSFQNYFDAELRNIYAKDGKITAFVEKEIKALTDDASLMIVDLKFASFEAAISPNSITTTAPFSYLKEPSKIKKQIFKSYEDDIFYGDLNDPQTLAKFEKKFSREERSGIFKPLEETVFHPTKYSFRYGKSFKDLKRSFNQISAESGKKLIPPSEKKETPDALYKIYVIADGDMDLFGHKPKFKKMLATEKMERADYPLQLSRIRSNDADIVLKEPLTADVRYDEEEDLYYISYPDLDILVWGKERQQADEAFQFTFVSLIQTIYNEDDANLMKKAKAIKKKLATLVDQIK